MLRFDITAVVLVACLFNFGDAAITGWATPAGIPAGTGGTATGISKAENTALNAVIVTFEAESGATVTGYALITTGSPFSLDTSSGELTLTTALDYETTTSYTIEVEASDDASGSGTATLVITVTDINEPTFGATSYTVCVTDASAADTSVTTFSATDADSGDTITYSINSGNDAGDFTIATADLKVASGKTLFRNTTASYTLVIHATDSGSPATSGSATYTVNVQTSCSSGAAALTMTFITLFLALISSLN